MTFHLGLATSTPTEGCCRKPEACHRIDGCDLLRHPRKRWLTGDPEAPCPKTWAVDPTSGAEGSFTCRLRAGHDGFCEAAA